jgi:tetratricopeptide (TPR) repeat protein
MLARVSYLMGDWKRSVDLLHEAHELCEEGTLEESRICRKIAEVEMARSEWKVAMDHFDHANAISERLGDTRGLAEGHRGIAWIYIETGESEKAKEYAERAVKEARQVGDTYLASKATIDLGNVYNTLADYDRALALYEEALKTMDTTRDLDQASRAHINIGDVLIKQEKYEKAIACFENSIEIVKATGEKIQYAYALVNIGECYMKMGEGEKAMPYLDEGIGLFETMGDNMALIVAKTFKACVLRDRGDLEASEAMFKEAIDQGNVRGLVIAVAVAYMDYSDLLVKKGDKAKAKELLLMAKDIFTRTNRKRGLDMVTQKLDAL